jgi:hypothetical protein
MINVRGQPPSLGGEKFVVLEVIKDSFHAARGIIQRDFVSSYDIAGDLAHILALFESLPDDHRSFIQLKVLLGIQIDENPLAAVKIGNYYMFPRYEIS